MWYNDAEDYVSYGLVIGALVLCYSLYRHAATMRTLSLMALAFGAGLNLGIHKTALGSFYLPLGVMQQQMHCEWGLPIENLLRDVDKDEDERETQGLPRQAILPCNR
jgi:hypothetical protein